MNTVLDIKQISAADINSMSYNELIGLVRETNRTPGGNRSIHRVASRCFLDRTSRVLEIGTSTGSTAIELGSLVGCEVIGIDVNSQSINEASRRAGLEGLTRVRFQQADATRLPFEDESFDLVFCGNVTSLIRDRHAALNEYQRVVRSGGYVAAIPLYYIETPPATLVDEVRRAIQVDIPVHHKAQATQFYCDSAQLELYDAFDYRFDTITEERVSSFCDEILLRPHLATLSEVARIALRDLYTRYMLLFRRNLSLMGFTIMILRKTGFKPDPELFTSREVAGS